MLIIDDAGITIMSESKFKFTDDGVSVEKIGAIGGAVFIAGEEQGEVLGYGGIDLQITEYKKGMIFSTKIGQGVLCVATDLKIQIGFIRAILKKYAQKIAKILNNYLKETKESGIINKELKELMKSDTLGFF